jgi:DNA-binding NarL/FixJ family response regulator
MAEIRQLLRLFFEADPRFEVVAEGVDGAQAIQIAVEVAPDLLVMDQRMPNLTGVEALPEIGRRAPTTAVVLYSGDVDPHLSGRALAAGALAVVDKSQVDPSIVDRFADLLLGHWVGPEAEVEVRLGPVASAAARVWVENTSKIVQALRAHPDVLSEPVADEVLDVFDRLLVTWSQVAAATDEFYWAARAEVKEVEWLVECWARIDRMSDEQLGALGVHWSPPEGEPFFRALSTCVINAVSAREDMQALATVLTGQWT